jgi:hypothetical protein
MYFDQEELYLSPSDLKSDTVMLLIVLGNDVYISETGMDLNLFLSGWN